MPKPWIQDKGVLTIKPKVLIWDIETSHNVVCAFQLRSENGIPYQGILKERNIFTVAWKWRGEKKVHSTAVNPKTPDNDKEVVRTILDLFSKADAVVAHYGDGFDMKYVATRALYHGFKPPPPVTQIDTWKIARSKFLFNSNRLDYLGKFLGLGGKIQTDHSLWMGCMKGDIKSIRKMRRYNEQDVNLLGKVFERIAPYVASKINASVAQEVSCCPNCQSKNLQARGYARTRLRLLQRFHCNDCGHWAQGKPVSKPSELR